MHRSSSLHLPLLLPGLLAGLLAAGCARGTQANLSNQGPGGSGNPVDPPPGPTDFAPLAGLISAAAGPGTVHLSWREPRPSDSKSFELALFFSTDRDTVFDGAPIIEPLSGTELMLDSLADGQRLYFGLGLREVPGGTGGTQAIGLGYRQTGQILTATPGPVVYVDPAADPMVADGLTPATAFPDPRFAILFAGFSPGAGKNVWLRAGTYENVGFIAQGAGIHVYGGFDETFDLATRDATFGATVLNGLPDGGAGQTLMIEMQALPQIPIIDPIAILDGVTLAGNDVSFRGVEITSTAAEFRSVQFTGFRASGLRMQNSDNIEYDVVVTECAFVANQGEGMDGRGAFDISIDGSVFLSNGFEGLDMNDWEAPAGESVQLRVVGSRFFGNGSEGMDIDLNVPLGILDLSGGHFSIEVRGCSFERNHLDGLLLDMEYDLFPQWDAEIVVRECLMRANGMSGLQLDLDGPGSTMIHRVLAVGNGAGGIVIGSESVPGAAIVSSSVCVGNRGPGINAINPNVGVGRRNVVVTHCILAGNDGPGIASQNEPVVASSVLSHLQPVAGVMTEFRASHLSSSTSEEMFVNAASGYAWIDAVSEEGVLTLSAPADFEPGTTLEVGDDGNALTAATVDLELVTTDPAPALVLPPDLLSYFSGDEVVEDYRLVSGAPAEAVGLDGADCGVFGAPIPGVPGFAEEIRTDLFHALLVRPTPASTFLSTDPIEIVFNELVAAGTVNATTVRVLDEAGTPLAVTLDTQAERLVISPPPGGWSGVFWVEVLGGVQSDGGLTNVAPLAMRYVGN